MCSSDLEPSQPAAVQAQSAGGEPTETKPAKSEPPQPEPGPDAAPGKGTKIAPAKVKAPARKQLSKDASTSKPFVDPRMELKAAKLREERAQEQAPIQESP